MAGIAGLLQTLFNGRPGGWRDSLRRRTEAQSAPPATEDAFRPPEGFVDVLAASDLAEGELVEVFVDDESVVLCRIDGEVHAVHGLCPHAAGPLADGHLDGHTLVCPMHGWGFDVRTGACSVAADLPVPTIAVRDLGGRICVRRDAVPDTGAPATS